MPYSSSRFSVSRLAISACIAGALAMSTLAAHAQESSPAASVDTTSLATRSPSEVLVGTLAAVPAPALPVKAWLTLDATSGQIIAAENIDERVEPASLTKLMAAYLVFDALESQRLTLDQGVNVSEQAWRMEGSRMFIKPNTQVSVHDLLQGMIVQSGNDATVALAEAVAGSESAFVALMNQEAQRQGLTSTHFTNSPGMPDPEHMTSVRDLGVLAKNLVMQFPQYTHYYSQKEYTYNNIKQNNRNRLLWLDPTVDGLKTGHTQSAGYCLVATAVRDGRRVITVVVGANNDGARAESSLRLMNWSFQNFDTLALFDADHPVVQARIWQGQQETVGLGATEPMWVTVPRGQAELLKPEARYAQPLVAPQQKGAQVGSVAMTLNGQVLRNEPLYVLDDVAEAGFFGRLYDKIRLMFE